jgi:penicillin-binding protein 2
MSQKPSKSLFPLQHQEWNDAVSSVEDDTFAEYAFGGGAKTAGEGARGYLGATIPKGRYIGGIIGLIFVLSLFALKTSLWQVVQGEELRAQAEENRMYAITLPAQRGIIYDRQGIILAENESLFQLVADFDGLAIMDDEQEVCLNRAILESNILFSLANSYGLPASSLFEAREEHPSGEFILAELSHEQAMQFLSLQTETYWHVEATSRRHSITNQVPTLSHVLGYTATISPEEYEEVQGGDYRAFDQIGKQGIEQQYEERLRGTFGQELYEIDAYGDLERAYSKTDPIDGENLHLTIDIGLQSYIEEVLEARLEGTPASRASVIVMDPDSGEVLALVSYPGFDANAFTQGIDAESYAALLEDEDRPLYPRATSGEFPSGSTIKPTFAAAALIEGIITAQTSFLSTGGVAIGPWFFPDWRAGGHGPTNVYHAIADSVNTFFYLIGGGNETFDGLGIEALMDYAAQFGLGTPTGIDLPSEGDGFLPTKQWKLETIGEQWYIGDTYNASIGQGYTLVTPLQMARNTAIFANGGALVTPHLLLGTETEEPMQVADADTMAIIRDAMRRTVTYGSASYLQGVSVPVAGKTGTAQWSTNNPDHSWFTGFAPYEDPEVVITVLVEEGGDRGLAVPVTHDILNWWFSGR